MSLFRNRKMGSGEKVNPVYLVIAAIVMPFVEIARWCVDKTYSTWKALITVPLAIAASFGGAIAASNYASNAWDLGGFWTGVTGVAAWLAVMFYAFPLFWRFIAVPVSEFCEAVYDRTRAITLKYSRPFFEFFCNAASTICIGSRGAMTRVLSKEHEDTWFAELLAIVAYVSSFGGFGYLAWKTYGLVGTLITFPVVGFALSAAAGLLVFGIGFGLLSQFLKYGKMAFIGVAASAGAVWGAAPYVVAWTGATGLWVYAAYAASFVVALGYVFPFVNVILTSGFWAKVWAFLKPLPEKTYDDRDEKYAEFFHHVVNFAATAAITYGAWYVGSAAGLALWGLAPVAVVVAALAYIVGFKAINHGGGNYITGALLSLWAAYSTGVWYTGSHFVYGIYGGIVAGVLAALVTGVVAFPVAYLFVRAILNTLGASVLAGPLTALYNAVNDGFKQVLKGVRKAFDAAYRDKSNYKTLVVQGVNLAVTYAAFTGTVSLVAGFGTGALLGWAAVALATFLTYMLVGKLLQKSGYGLEFIGAAASLYAAVEVGQLVYATGASATMMVAAVATGIAIWATLFCVLFPVVYIVLRFVSGWALSWLGPILASVHEWLWSGFARFVRAFEFTYMWLWRLTAPIRACIARAWAGVAEQYRKLLRIIRGGN